MPRAKRSVTKKIKFGGKDEGDSDESPAASESDFDEDDDPDKIEVPGGGKDLATSVTLNNRIEEKPPVLSMTKMAQQPYPMQQPGQPSLQQKFLQQQQQQQQQQALLKGKLQQNMYSLNKLQGPLPNKIPGGLVTKGSMNPGFEMVRGTMGGMSNMPGQYVNMPSAANMLANFAYSPVMMPPNMNSQFLQQSLQGMGSGDMGFPGNLGSMSGLGQFLSMGGNNHALLSQLMNAGMHPGMWGMMPNKAVASMWGGEDSKATRDAVDDEENDDEDMGVAETYSDYMPTKLKLGKKHPDPVVETASLSSVEPTEVWYQLSLPEETISTGALSALQLEAITYASQQHEHFLPDGTRAGFLIGDGAGVGKGRTIAGCIFENFLKGRKRAIWVSVSNDLKYDSERDLKDIGASKVEVYSLNKFKYAKISSPVNGNVKKGVIFSTYSALIGESSQSGGKYKTRLKQLLQWCGDDFDGLVVFDECHRAKNLCPVGSSKPTKTGLTVLELQNKLPKARVVYASATGASEPRNMAYMTRLGMWGEGTPFPEFTDFISAVEKRGVGAMEIVAMDMKLRGMYIARQLSFHGVAFKIEEVPLSKEFVKVYDDSVSLWVEAMQRFQEAAELIDAENRMKKTMWGQFWSSHQRFFKYLCIAAKVKHAVMTAREAVKCGKCVVIGLQSTGEARTLEQLERDDGELSDFVSTAKGVLQTLVEKHFPAPDRNRISRLLGLEHNPKKEKQNHVNGADSGGGGEGSSVGGKRKPVRQAAARAVKRVRKDSSESDSEKFYSSDSEFKLSASEDSAGEISEESNASSDFNPFDEDSDSGGTYLQPGHR